MPVLKVRKNNVWVKIGGTSPMDGGNADTLDGKHASHFGTSSDVENLKNLVGTTTVQTQINNAMNTLREEILGGSW